MPTPTRVWTVFALLASAVSWAGCDSPTSPTSTASATGLPSGAVLVNVSGFLRDPLFRPVSGARVELTDGEYAGLTTVSDEMGHFDFRVSVPSTVATTVTVTKDGYKPVSMQWPARSEAYIFLSQVNTAGPTGDYTVRFVADTSCTQIPAALRTRSYPGRAAAETGGLNSRFMMSLSDRNLYEHYSRYWGVAAGDDVRLVIFSWDAIAAWLEDHPIIERVDATAYLAVSGVTTATVSPQRSVDASFEGEFQYCPARVEPTMSGYPPTCAVPPAQCRSSQHRVVVTPR